MFLHGAPQFFGPTDGVAFHATVRPGTDGRGVGDDIGFRVHFFQNFVGVFGGLSATP